MIIYLNHNYILGGFYLDFKERFIKEIHLYILELNFLMMCGINLICIIVSPRPC